MQEKYYFAYGSNMNRDQMNFRCPRARVVTAVRLEDYRLTFSGASGNGVATILPEPGSHVDGVLWTITPHCEASLNRYEGYPNLYGKAQVTVCNIQGVKTEVMAYVMNAPYKDWTALPSETYLRGILEGCRQNGLSTQPVMEAVQRTQGEAKATAGKNKQSNKDRTR